MPRSHLTIATFFLCVVSIFVTATPSFAADRVALVIGNGLYQKVPALPNPTRDATDIGQAFERLNFKVTQLSNASAAEMRKAIVEFGRSAEGSEVAIVYYAGHGMEAGGENWLIPIDAELRSDTDVESEAVSLRSVNLQVSKARLLGLVILDACRNNPFAAKMQRSLRTRAVTRGLAPMEPTDNVLVAYAARDGTTANDGDGRNSPFTAALLHNIETPGLEISFLFRNVRDEVMAATKREQQPFVYGSLSKEAIYLKPLPVSASPRAPALAEVTAPAEDEQFWQAIKTSTVPGLYEEFLKRYPTTSHLFEARERLFDLRSKQVASVAPQTVDSPSTAVDAVDKAGSPKDSRSQNPNDVIEQKRNLYTPEDAQRVAAIGAELKLKMPPFSIGTTKSDVPNSYRQFVGVWSGKVGYNGGKGRQGMLIVTETYSDGLALGFYLYGPPTKLDWEKDTPAGYVALLGRISDGTLRFKSGVTPMEARLVGANAMTLHATNPTNKSETATIKLGPLWQLVPTDPTARGKLPGDRNESTPATRKKTTESSLSPDERKTNPPKPQNSKDSTQALYAQCSAEGHRLTGSKHTNVGFSRIEACARNGGKM